MNLNDIKDFLIDLKKRPLATLAYLLVFGVAVGSYAFLGTIGGEAGKASALFILAVVGFEQDAKAELPEISDDEQELWDEVKDSIDPDSYRFFIRKYPDSTFYELAAFQICKLEPEETLQILEAGVEEEFRLDLLEPQDCISAVEPVKYVPYVIPPEQRSQISKLTRRIEELERISLSEPPQVSSKEQLLWDEVKDSDDPDTLHLFRRNYPDSAFDGLAGLLIAKLEPEKTLQELEMRQKLETLETGVEKELRLDTIRPEDIATAVKPSGLLEIHYINVGQGGSTLIIGPNGTRILYDFGNVSGNRDIVPYLRSIIGSSAIDYTFVSHRDADHYMGYKEVIEAGYDVTIANYDPGSPKTSSKIRERWLKPAEATTAGAVRPIPVGLAIALGDGAVARVMAANGRIFGDAIPVELSNENDRSISLYITYGNFQYILDGDLGGGREACSNHDTSQVNVQTRIAQSLLDIGLMSEEHGVDVLHIAHHGSESSTPASYFNLVKPEVGLISVGVKQGNFKHPRVDVVDVILLDGDLRATAACNLVAPLVELLQTEDGKPGESSTGSTSFSGKTIGNIKLVTDGQREYTITGDNQVHEGGLESDEPYNRTFRLDEVP